ncbi:hypothetical protein ACFW6V_26175 [Streptomyces sp. NPDC058734]|uniref:hypothetical protein n=1 Tax=Streptomyces sp. NPDC058734 TaxID=3346615 RepID=UPI0036D08236
MAGGAPWPSGSDAAPRTFAALGPACGTRIDAYLKFGAYGGTADGLTIDCRRGQESYGAIGRFFDETGTDFGRAESMGAYLADLADQLERGRDGGAVTFNGRLFWEWARPPDRTGAAPTTPFPDRTSSCRTWTCPAAPPMP